MCDMETATQEAKMPGQRVKTIYGETGEVVCVWGEIMRTVRLDDGRYVQCHHLKIWAL